MKRILPEAQIPAQTNNLIKSLAAQCDLMEDTVKILYSRGIDTAEKINGFIHPSKSRFISPFKMSGMQQAVDLIKRARDEEWAVVVYGDYDADGVCAATIMCNGLRDFGIEPMVYVPERKNGYGLNTTNIDEIFEEYFPQLFITVDCGISNAEEVEYIKEQGAEVIVTDHHELPDVLPDCICINPKFNDGYPYDNLCGAGVAFKVSCALNGESAYRYLDFAAIATVADSVPLLGENRDIVYEGLNLINNKPRANYASFLGKSGDTVVTAQTLAFSIAPKINAAGRLGNANAALRLFNEQDKKAISDLSVLLTEYNIERQQYCDELYQGAKQKLSQTGAYGRVIMLWDEQWNTGFVGIVAARLAEEYGRPALLFVKNGNMLKGSARSIESVNIFEALKACSQYIGEFGGHSQAAGINIAEENFNDLEKALNAYLEQNYSQEAFTPTLYICNNVQGEACTRFAKELEMLEPYGVGNKRPLFALTEECCHVSPVKPQSPHLSIKTNELDLMFFNGGKYTKILQSAVPKKIVFEYNVSRFRGKEYVKGFVRDVVYDGETPQAAADEIAVNTVLSFAEPAVACTITECSVAKINQMMAEDTQAYGTLYLANDAQTLSHFPQSKGLPRELFMLSSRNLANTILIAPQLDLDVSGYQKIVWLDKPHHISLPTLAGKQVVVCNELEGSNAILSLNADRKNLLNFYSYLVAHMQEVEGANVEEASLKNNFGVSSAQAAFALKVFEQLSLITFESGKLVIYRGVKTNLTNSPLYNAVLQLTQN
jgi:single-stranded-DNA-specific exonuclease